MKTQLILDKEILIKRIITIIVFAAVLVFSKQASSQWQLIPGVTEERLFAISTVSYTDIFAGGKSGLLLHSTDGGDTWFEVVHDGQEDIMSICFPNNLVGITAGGAGELMRTGDAGQTWSLIDAGIDEDLSDLSFPDALHGYAVGTGGLIAKTSDGGQSWQQLSAGLTDEIVAVHFITENTGFILTAAYELLMTNDAGINWIITELSSSGEGWNDLFFQNASEGFIVGAAGGILETSDGGLTWSELLSPTETDLLSIDFPDPLNGYISGDNGEILSTVDGGATWISATTLTSERLHDIHFFDANFGFTVGRQGTIIRYNLATGQKEEYASNSQVISVWPNPVRDKVTIFLPEDMSEITEVSIYNAAGNLAMSQSVNDQTGSSITVETTGLSSGLYILTLSDGSNQTRSVKIVK